MGVEKLLLDLRGKPVLRWTLEAALASSLCEVLCVAREPEEMAAKIALRDPKLRWIASPRAELGQSQSVIAGIAALESAIDAALFLVGDQPLVETSLIDRLVQEYRAQRPPIVAARHAGEPRNPVLFSRELFAELAALAGDRGGRALLERHRGRAVFVDWPDERPFVDLDGWEDYERLKRI